MFNGYKAASPNSLVSQIKVGCWAVTVEINEIAYLDVSGVYFLLKYGSVLVVSRREGKAVSPIRGGVFCLVQYEHL